MKKIVLMSAVLAGGYCFGQAPLVPVSSVAQANPTPMSRVPNDQLFKDASNIYFYNEFYMIDGRKVAGFPFLFHDWHNGIITTADDRVFTGYKVKYNVFGQSVFFHNGTDSLEVNEKIKEFDILVSNGDSLEKYRFINADQYEAVKKPLYYQVLADKPSYQVLKSFRKSVTEADKALPVQEARKMFAMESSYFFYNKNTKKLSRIKANGTNIADMLNIDAAQASVLKLSGYDFSQESEILRFFEDYSKTKQ